MNRTIQYVQIKRIILWGALSNLVLAFAKTSVGYGGQSHALLADGFHSFADILVDLLVWAAAHFGHRGADHDHPYGHGRIETAATVGLAIFLVLIGFGILLEAIQSLLDFSQIPIPKTYVLWTVIAAFFIKEAFYFLTLYVAKKHQSDLLIANAWHHRSDSITSLIVFLGVLGAYLGWSFFDAIAAVLVAFLIIWMGVKLAWGSLRELIDTGLVGQRLACIEQLILSVAGVLEIHQLRTRSMAGSIFVDVHILVSSQLTVSEGHFISQMVHLKLTQELEWVRDVTVHVDVEPDGTLEENCKLPTRVELMPDLMRAWSQLPGDGLIQKVNLHYLAGKISIEVFFPMNLLQRIQTPNELRDQYQYALRHLTYIDLVYLVFIV